MADNQLTKFLKRSDASEQIYGRADTFQSLHLQYLPIVHRIQKGRWMQKGFLFPFDQRSFPSGSLLMFDHLLFVFFSLVQLQSIYLIPFDR
ncbi:hypothetical protein D3C87_1647010 [compost metagenome]